MPSKSKIEVKKSLSYQRIQGKELSLQPIRVQIIKEANTNLILSFMLFNEIFQLRCAQRKT